MASVFAAGHSDGSFERYIAPNLVNCGSTGSYGPRLARRDGSCGFFLVGLFFCLIGKSPQRGRSSDDRASLRLPVGSSRVCMDGPGNRGSFC